MVLTQQACSASDLDSQIQERLEAGAVGGLVPGHCPHKSPCRIQSPPSEPAAGRCRTPPGSVQAVEVLVPAGPLNRQTGHKIKTDIYQPSNNQRTDSDEEMIRFSGLSDSI